MKALEVEFVNGTLHLNGRPAQEWIDLADSEGTRAVQYLRRARKAEHALGVLADAADAVGVAHFDSDDLSAEVQAMQTATLLARALLADRKPPNAGIQARP